MGIPINQFIDQVFPSFICQICEEVLEKPVLCSLCEALFCNECVSIQYLKSCPSCNEANFGLKIPFKSFTETIENLKVSCKNKKCQVQAQLKSIRMHQEFECQFKESDQGLKNQEETQEEIFQKDGVVYLRNKSQVQLMLINKLQNDIWYKENQIKKMQI